MLSDTIDRKFEQILVAPDYEILTDDGWKDIAFVGKTVKYQIYEIKTTNHCLKCADDHIVFDENFQERFVKDLNVNDKIMTANGPEQITNMIVHDEYDNMYDVQVLDLNHRYYTNGILSHNSTIYCIYALWYTTFFPEKKVMVLANKAQTALELLSRISLAYEYLPNWIKCAVVEFNKSSITFANMSCIKAFASSSDSARGFSANCVSLRAYSVIRFKFLPFLKFKVRMSTLEKIAKITNKIIQIIDKFKRK